MIVERDGGRYCSVCGWIIALTEDSCLRCTPPDSQVERNAHDPFTCECEACNELRASVNAEVPEPVQTNEPPSSTERKPLPPRIITVCAACHKASCWYDVFPCEKHKTAGTIEMSSADLDKLALELPSHYSESEVRRHTGAEPRYVVPHSSQPGQGSENEAIPPAGQAPENDVSTDEKRVPTAEEVGHTPGPWVVNSIAPQSVIAVGYGSIAWCGVPSLSLPSDRANARRIVQCCNAHDELVAGCAQAHQYLTDLELDRALTMYEYEFLGALKAALAKAQGDA